MYSQSQDDPSILLNTKSPKKCSEILCFPNKLCVCVCVCVSCSVMSDSVTPWTVARQATLSVGFSRQEYRSGLSFLSPKDLPKPRIEPRSPALQADSLLSESSGKLCTV